jgi:TonB family protein
MSKKVLLIEYEPRYIERIRTLLIPLGHTITEAHDGEAGLQAFGGSRFDLILLSGMLPRLPSAEVIREVRKKGGATAPPIILMMTGYRGSNRKADAQKVGAFDILVRPFTDEDFMASVREVVDATDVGSRTMRIDTSQIAAAASPLTSSDIFSDVLDELTEDAPRKAPEPTPSAPPPAAPVPPATEPPTPSPTPAPPRAAPVESDMDKRLRDTLSGLMAPRPTVAARAETPPDKTPPPIAPAVPSPAAPPRPKLSSDTDVDRMISDTLSGLARPKPKTSPGVTPAPATATPSAPAPSARRREEPAAAVPSSGPDRFGQYEVLERIAAGGMAELYKAKRTGVEGFQKIVAIKKILPHLADDEEFVTMFADEAKLAAQLNHPNIIHIYDLGKIQAGGYFIAMEYVDGRDLRAIQQAGSTMGVPLPVPLAVYVASKVASALDYAHRRRDAEGHELNIVHRDVSPQNILISYEGDIKLCDFGIAKAASKASKTQSGALKGKIQYMSPEQAWGKPIDRRSDLFSLGVVLHELLTGERLFRGDNDISVLEKVRSAEVPAPSGANPEVPHNLDAVVLKALAKEPDDRYANASDLLRDLDSVLYSYTPAPGSADVAIYLHRLQAEEGAVAEAKAREAVQVAEEAEPTAARKRKSKGAPVSRKTGSTPKPAAAHPPAAAAPAPPSPPPPPAVPAPPPPREPSRPAPEVFGSMEAQSAEAERKSRTPLIAGVVVVALALVAFLAWRMMKPQGTPVPVVAPTPAAAVPTAEPTSAAAPAPTPAAAPIDPKAVEAEVQRQLAVKRKELEKTATAAKNPPVTTGTSAAAPAEPAAAPAPALAEPTAIPTLAPTPIPVPTAVPTEPPPVEPPKPPPAREPETQRGDLVGPGAGVIEPTLVAPPRIVYPPIAREQRVQGKVVVLVLIDENGRVAEARMQQGVSQAAVNDAVLAGVKSAKFRAATKNGTPVKMWRPVLIEVKP